MKTMRLMMTLTALTSLTACDYVRDRQDLAQEREDGAYRAALADYRAGRLDAAAKGFAKVIRKSPANSAARFQYACLMQDTKKDCLEAYCAYREFLMQRPDSDKAQLAKDRLAICERELARELADRYRLLDNEAFAKEIESLRKDLKVAETRASSAEKLLAEERAKYRALDGEHERLLTAVKGTGADETTQRRTSVDVKDLLDEEEDEKATARDTTLATAAALKAEEAEETTDGTTLLPKRTVDDVAQRAAAQAVREEEDRSAAERAAAEREKSRRPSTYVVQEGDTLYKIALRFYGHVSAWRRIRDANKAIISNDGRVRAGQTIALP